MLLDPLYRLNGMFHGAAPNGFFARLRRRLNFGGKYSFSPRGGLQSKRLVIVVAGYKAALWDRVFRRIAKALPVDTDVCVVVPEIEPGVLVELCAQHNWSLLHLKANRLSVAQNIAIQLHPCAELIHKLDEDIVVSQDYFRRLESTLLEAETGRTIAQVGIVAPVSNVNGYSYRIFLEKLGLLGAYEKQFGRAVQQATMHPIWKDPTAAQWVWERSLPFDEIADRLFTGALEFSCCWHLFSIGAILFRRSFWEAQQGFTAAGEGVLGVEERDVCAFSVVNCYATVVSHNVFAGHVGFGPQTAVMLPWLAGREGW